MIKERYIEIITDTKQLLSDPERWTKGAYARYGRDGKQIWPKEELAKCFCLGGAVIKLTSNASECNAITDVLNIQIRRGKKYYTLPQFNDAPETTHEDIIGLLDKALETI